MATIRQKAKAAESLGMFFLENGRIYEEGEYKLAGHVPVRYALVKSFFGSWAKAVDSIRIHCPDLYKEILSMDDEPEPVDPLQELQAKTSEALKKEVDAEIVAELDDESKDE